MDPLWYPFVGQALRYPAHVDPGHCPGSEEGVPRVTQRPEGPLTRRKWLATAMPPGHRRCRRADSNGCGGSDENYSKPFPSWKSLGKTEFLVREWTP